jgi:MSHA biogenesis protein MshI
MDRRSSLYDRIGLEVQRSLDNYDRQYGGFLPLSRLVIAPQPEAMPLQGYLKDYLGIPVDTVDLSDLMDISAVPALKDPARQSQSLLCLGAALRDEAAA